MIKTSIRFFDDIPVRAVWNEEDSKWYFCAVDIAEALTGSKSPRKYWNFKDEKSAVVLNL